MRRAVVLVVVIAAACGSSAAPSAMPCAARSPERVVDSPLDLKDLSVTTPKGTLDMNGDRTRDQVSVENGVVTVDDLVLNTSEAAGVSIRTWADVDGDGDDDLLVDDGSLWLIEGGEHTGTHAVNDIGVHVPDGLTSMWLGDLDGAPGGDFYLVQANPSGTVTHVYSGKDALHGRFASDPVDLRGSPRALARLDNGGPLETVLLDPGPPSTLTFAPRTRAPLRANLGESHRVTWVRVFDEHGTRKIALTVDRKTAIWAVPAPCKGV